MQYIHTTISAKEIDHTREYIFYIRKVLCPQYFQNTFTKNRNYYVVIGSNLNLLLKLLFCPPITTLTNCHLKFVVKVFILQLTKDSLINNSIQTFLSSDYSLRHVQALIPHTPNYYKKESLDGGPKILGKDFKPKILWIS